MYGCLVAKVGGVPKREFRIVPYGAVDAVNAAKGGPFTFTREHARQAVSWFQRVGRKLMIDYEHQSVQSLNTRPDGLSPAAGWIGRIEARPDGLWAADVEWTAAAAEALRRGEYAYFSPVIYWGDRNHGTLDSLGPIALTNDPSMTNVEPLVATRLHVDVFAGDGAGGSETSPGRTPRGATQGDGMSPMDRVAEALGLAPGASLEEILAEIKRRGGAQTTAAIRARLGQLEAGVTALTGCPARGANDEAGWAAEYDANLPDAETGRPLQDCFMSRDNYVHYMKAVQDGLVTTRPSRQQRAATVAKRRAEEGMSDATFEAVLRREWNGNVVDETGRRVRECFFSFENFAAYRRGVRSERITA
ncbi:MAG: phage protease [Phycisphaerae bacterium]